MFAMTQLLRIIGWDAYSILALKGMCTNGLTFLSWPIPDDKG